MSVMALSSIVVVSTVPPPNAINRPLPDDLWQRQKSCVLSQYSRMSVVDKVSSPDRVRSLQCNEISPHIRECKVMVIVCFVLYQGT